MAESAADEAGNDGTCDTITITRFLLPHPHLQELNIVMEQPLVLSL